ncbi:MAG: MraY family glycosyltransferase [Patescibacteria group bacterium]|nr:MAG: MraY family glycosyltransferase [Patescibacteria group bacterium]
MENYEQYLIYGVIALVVFLLSWSLSVVVAVLAIRFKVLDKPDGERKKHKQATPLWGGLALGAAILLGLWLGRGFLIIGDLEPAHWWAVALGGLILIIGGALDDKYNLKPSRQIIFPILASLTVIIGGVGIEKISGPNGELLYLGILTVPLTFLWILGMSYTTKLLDGLDGLVASLGTVAGIIIFLFTMTTRWYQPDIGFAALVLAAACLGFLMLNWSPARLFLGEGGSLLIGYFLGVLSVISGGKIAIALLIMGLPVLDVAWTIIRRIGAGHNPFKHADRQHLHFRFLDAGFSVKQTVIIMSSAALLFGLSALFLQSRGKVVGLIVLGLLMIIILSFLSLLDKKRGMR